jgi:hypothetical protein
VSLREFFSWSVYFSRAVDVGQGACAGLDGKNSSLKFFGISGMGLCTLCLSGTKLAPEFLDGLEVLSILKKF